MLTGTAIRTAIFEKDQALHEFIVRSVDARLIREGLIICVTSKIVGLSEGRTHESSHKKNTVRKEADLYLGEVGYGAALTIKHGLLMLGAGVDESNSKSGDLILYPRDPFANAESLTRSLRKTWGLAKLGVILTDSQSAPLRRGTRGAALAHFGFHGVRDMVGQPDLFGRPLKITQMNLVDALASLAVLLMGEGNESQPLAAIHGADVDFADDVPRGEIQISLDDDMYAPMLKAFIASKKTD
jgi:dihydrofolate synthase / folylpolyglutamate synthase